MQQNTTAAKEDSKNAINSETAGKEKHQSMVDSKKTTEQV